MELIDNAIICQMKQVLIALCLSLIPLAVSADSLQGKFIKVADGDTVTIVDDRGKKHTVFDLLE